MPNSAMADHIEVMVVVVFEIQTSFPLHMCFMVVFSTPSSSVDPSFLAGVCPSVPPAASSSPTPIQLYKVVILSARAVPFAGLGTSTSAPFKAFSALSAFPSASSRRTIFSFHGHNINISHGPWTRVAGTHPGEGGLGVVDKSTMLTRGKETSGPWTRVPCPQAREGGPHATSAPSALHGRVLNRPTGRRS